MIHKIQVALMILLVPLGGLYLYSQSQGISLRDLLTFGPPVVHVGEIPIRVEIADTGEKRTRGLSGRVALENIGGMLFVFDTADYHEIWMKDMQFPIDIIWIDETLTVVSIDQMVQPNSYPRKYRPEHPARYAIETNARYTDMFGIRVGHSVRLPLQISQNTVK